MGIYCLCNLGYLACLYNCTYKMVYSWFDDLNKCLEWFFYWFLSISCLSNGSVTSLFICSTLCLVLSVALSCMVLWPSVRSSVLPCPVWSSGPLCGPLCCPVLYGPLALCLVLCVVLFCMVLWPSVWFSIWWLGQVNSLIDHDVVYETWLDQTKATSGKNMMRA